MQVKTALLAAIFVLACPATLLADIFQYQFTGSQFSNDAQFTFTTNSLITADIVVTPTSCSYDLGSGPIDCNSIEVDHFNAGDFFILPVDLSNNALELFTGFSFTQIGTQSNIVSALTITDLSASAPVPEPSSLTLLGTGAMLLMSIASRRFLLQSPR